jgi:xanthosine utilization system XapX-like protein
MYMYDPAKTNAAMVVVNLLELPEASEAIVAIVGDTVGAMVGAVVIPSIPPIQQTCEICIGYVLHAR